MCLNPTFYNLLLYNLSKKYNIYIFQSFFKFNIDYIIILKFPFLLFPLNKYINIMFIVYLYTNELETNTNPISTLFLFIIKNFLVFFVFFQFNK